MKAMTKEEVLAGPSCLTRSQDTEPVFVLCGRDPAAPAAIRAWAEQARKDNIHELTKIRAAEEQACDFEAWLAANPKTKAQD